MKTWVPLHIQPELKDGWITANHHLQVQPSAGFLKETETDGLVGRSFGNFGSPTLLRTPFHSRRTRDMKSSGCGARVGGCAVGEISISAGQNLNGSPFFVPQTICATNVQNMGENKKQGSKFDFPVKWAQSVVGPVSQWWVEMY